MGIKVQESWGVHPNLGGVYEEGHPRKIHGVAKTGHGIKGTLKLGKNIKTEQKRGMKGE